jgi:hypothetical protein
MINANEEEDNEQRAEREMFDGAFPVGEPDDPVTRADFDRLVKLCGTRFDSAARRANKGRKETREGIAALRTDLAPVITLSKLAPIFGAAAGLLPFIVVFLAKG